MAGVAPRRRTVADRGRIVDLCEGQARAGSAAAGLVPHARGRTQRQTLALGGHLASREAQGSFTGHRLNRAERSLRPHLSLRPRLCRIEFVSWLARYDDFDRPSRHPFRVFEAAETE